MNLKRIPFNLISIKNVIMFKDRKDAGIQLAKALKKYKHKYALVLGIAKGGIATAYHVARELDTDFSILACQKLTYPYNTEIAFGAITEDDGLYVNTEISQHIPPEFIEKEISDQKEEIVYQRLLFRGGEPLPPIRYRIVILVDDGIGSGSTLFAAIKMCKQKNARSIVVASPVADLATKIELQQLANDVIVLETPFFFKNISQSYQTFEKLSNEDVLSYMERWQTERLIKRLRTHRELL